MSASIMDVARRAGVSKSTVSRVLTDDVAVRPGTRLKVKEAMGAMGYHPNALARGLVHGRTHTLGLIVPDLLNPFFGLLARGVETAALARGYNVLISDSAANAARQHACLDLLAERRVDGVLIAPFGGEDDAFAAIRAAGLRGVLVNSTAGDPALSSVGADNVQGGYLAVAHLLARGHRRIGFLGDAHTVESCRERLVGYRRAHREAAVADDPAVVVEDLAGMEAVHAAVRRLLALPRPPTAIFTVNDQFAIACLQALSLLGRRVPEDIALVGYDDIPVAAWLSVPLTTMAQPKEEQGRLAADLLIDHIETADTPVQRIILQPRLVVRRSSDASRPPDAADINDADIQVDVHTYLEQTA